jgi:hypothetical protein
MVTSMEKLLEENGVSRESSIYRDVPGEILQYSITIGDYVETVSSQKAVEEFSILGAARQMEKTAFAKADEYQQICHGLNRISTRLKKPPKSVSDAPEMSPEERAQLRNCKQELMARKQEIVDGIHQQIIQKTGLDWREESVLQYKNTVFFSWLDDMKKQIPPLQQLALEDAEHIPFFISHFDNLTKALQKGEQVGIVGGPCLFGIDEVFIHLNMDDGQRVSFDCSCGRRCLRETKTEDTLEEYITKHHQHIAAIDLENRKEGVTRQEYDSIAYVFAFASALGAKVVIPLPDISYFKYMRCDLQGLEESRREQVMELFQQECYKISDLYLDLIRTVSRDYPEVEYRVLHARDRELCRLFYEKRSPYIQNSSYIQKITNVSGKKDAVVDYITMLALPYYVYGTRYVVQLDSVDETDSGRKCNKIHKQDMNLTQILYPEYLSRDGQNTIYNAPIEYKNYLELR